MNKKGSKFKKIKGWFKYSVNAPIIGGEFTEGVCFCVSFVTSVYGEDLVMGQDFPLLLYYVFKSIIITTICCTIADKIFDRYENYKETKIDDDNERR